MEETLFFKIKDDLCEMKHNGYEISEIEQYKDLEMNNTISFRYGGRKYVIQADIVEWEEE